METIIIEDENKIFFKLPENFTGLVKNKTNTFNHWYKNKKMHRENGPAYQKWFGENRLLIEETWVANDLTHRIDGPASWKLGSEDKHYYLFGTYQKSFDEYQNNISQLKSMNAGELWKVQFRTSLDSVERKAKTFLVLEKDEKFLFHKILLNKEIIFLDSFHGLKKVK